MPNGAGGGGGPIGVSNSFTGVAQALDLYGNFAAAFSGGVSVDNNETTLVEFTSGNFIFVGNWRADYFENAGDDVRWVLYFNDSKIQSISSNRNYEAGKEGPVDIVIPPYTQVKITAQNITDTSTLELMTSMVGAIYR